MNRIGCVVLLLFFVVMKLVVTGAVRTAITKTTTSDPATVRTMTCNLKLHNLQKHLQLQQE